METSKQQREDLRRLMREKMAARGAVTAVTSAPQQASANHAKDSAQNNPFLKVSSSGKLVCTVCPGVSIKSWTTHQFSAEHKRNVKAHKTVRTTASVSKPVQKTRVPEETAVALPKEPPRSILKNPLLKQHLQTSKGETEAKQSSDDSGEHRLGSPTKGNTSDLVEKKLVSEGVSLKQLTPSGVTSEPRASEHANGKGEKGKRELSDLSFGETKKETEEHSAGTFGSTLPEGFFDDPRLDAKARNQEYKDPQDIEWEKYQKALREEENKSEQVTEMDDEKHTRERNIYEADEQIRNWEIVRELEICREEQLKKPFSLDVQKADSDDHDLGEEEEDFHEEQFDELMSWRQKSIKK